MKNKMPTFFISHWGWPWPFMKEYENDKWYNSLKNYIKSIPNSLQSKPKLIIVISAHWEEKEISIMTNENPSIYYDYYWFPENTYNLEWNAKWDTKLAQEVIESLKSSWINTISNKNHNYDHWCFIPLMVAYPSLDIPIIQISLKKWLNPEEHINLWKSLEKLREKEVLIIWSWMSYHNMRWFFSWNWLESSRIFNENLEKIIIKDEYERNNDLKKWKEIPMAIECHPREEHLIPLIVISWAWWEDKWVITFKWEILWVEIICAKF